MENKTHYEGSDCMQDNVYGYVRVSSLEQNEDRQMLALKELEVKKNNIYIDK